MIYITQREIFPKSRISSLSRFSQNTTENEPFEDENELKSPRKHTYSHILTLINITKEHNGSYLCHFPENEREKNITHQISFVVVTVALPKILGPSNEEIKRKEKDNGDVYLKCTVETFPTDLFNGSVKWEKETIDVLENKDSSGSSEINAYIANKTLIVTNETHIDISIKIDKVSKKHNGTYICSVSQPLALEKEIGIVQKRTSILIQTVPIVMISFAKAIGKNRIFLNWTVSDNGNSPIKIFLIQFKQENDTEFRYVEDKIPGNVTSTVVIKLNPNSKYQFKISANNEIGTGPPTEWSNLVQTLNEDPIFIPVVEVKGNSHSTITIGWQPPPPDLLDYIHYYEVIVFQSNQTTVDEAIHPQNSRNLPYMVNDLKTATEYFFKVRACSEFNKECGKWSEVVNGTTMDGLSSAPLDIKISCNMSRRSYISVEWSAPINPNGIVTSYQVTLEGTAYFKNQSGKIEKSVYGPKAKNADRSQFAAVYENIPANTNYTVNVAAITRSKKPGDRAPASCTMPPTVPDQIPRVVWGKYQAESSNWIFKLLLPRVSERNGRICCYRIYMIRIGTSSNFEIPAEDLDVATYDEIHNINNTEGGAYMADIVASSRYTSEIFLGNSKRQKIFRNDPNGFAKKCKACLEHITRKKIRIVEKTSSSDDSDDDDEDEKIETASEVTNSDLETKVQRRRRHESTEPKQLNILGSLSMHHSSDFISLFDGPLDAKSNYSGFIEVIIENEDDNEEKQVSAFSEYFPIMSPQPPPFSNTDELPDNHMMMAITYLLAGLIILVISLFFLLCLLHRYQKKHIIQGNEIVSLTDSLRLLCHGGRANHHQHRSLNTVSKPPDLPPISREILPQSYIDRHKDSDYGFQHEFELLPDRFTDRTSRSGDMKENVYKNRYPDIKCYDQTRVKLSTLNGLIGSDYINANFVIGYKERKKFICAQGPMDSTITDFWRMIWEQHLEIIVMLTNLEEYNKTKCAKYWPERVSDSIQFGDITVSFETEQRYSDYVVRHMKVILNLNLFFSTKMNAISAYQKKYEWRF